MTTTKNENHAKALSAKLQDQYAIVNERAALRVQRRNDAGQIVPAISDDEWATVLERIANGEVQAQVLRSMGIEPSALNKKDNRDPEFKQAFSEALASAFFGHMMDARSVARGLEGYSTGSIERDKLVIDTDWKMAKALVPRLVDRQQIDQRSISITIQQDDADW